MKIEITGHAKRRYRQRINNKLNTPAVRDLLKEVLNELKEKINKNNGNYKKYSKKAKCKLIIRNYTLITVW